jgi:hypothetical protein
MAKSRTLRLGSLNLLTKVTLPIKIERITGDCQLHTATIRYMQRTPRDRSGCPWIANLFGVLCISFKLSQSQHNISDSF